MTQNVFNFLDNLINRGCLTYLNKAFAKFLYDLDTSSDSVVILAGALVSYQLNQGKVYLDLETFLQSPEQIFLPYCEINDNDISQLKSYQSNLLESIFSNSKLIGIGEGNTPLVWDKSHNRLYLRRYWQYQKIVDDSIAERLNSVRPYLPRQTQVQLNELFKNSIQPDWQKVACALALRSRFCIITGGPGTGKTTTLTKLLVLSIQLICEETKGNYKPNVLLAAPTGKACVRVSESINSAFNQLESSISSTVKERIPTKACTLHRLLGARPDTRLYKYNRHNPLIADIVIVDEASMIDLEMMAALLDALQKNTQLILLGDKDQLSSVEPGYVLGNLCKGAEDVAYSDDTTHWIEQYCNSSIIEHTVKIGSSINQQTVILQRSYRFDEKSGIGNLAKAVNAGEAKKSNDILNSGDYTDLQKITTDSELDKIISTSANNMNSYADYLNEIQNKPIATNQYDEWALNVLNAFDKFQVLSATRQGHWGVEGLNHRIQQWLFGQKTLPQWFEGRPIMITRNDYNLGLMNGDIGITLKDSNNKLQVAFINTHSQTNESIHWVSPLRLPDAQTAFAMTVHKSQGSEFNHVVLAIPETQNPVLTRELIYTAITRAKKNFTLLESKDGVFIQGVLAAMS